MESNFDFGRMIFDQANNMNMQFVAEPIIRVYDKVKDDPEARIPTALAMAIEAARRMEDQNKVNDRANDMVKRDQEAGPQSDYQMTTHGTPLRPGQ